MPLTTQKESVEVSGLDINLDRTTRPKSDSSDLVWEGEVLKCIGIWQMDCSSFKTLSSEIQCSLRDHIISFAKQRKYSLGTFRGIVRSINASLARYPTSELDLAWLLKAVNLRSFALHIGGIRSFFIYWQDRYSLAIPDDALQFLAHSHPRKNNSKNVLSDDPEKSWLTELEYDSILRCIWDNYDQAITDTQITLMRLLSLQYARRPHQLASLKLRDFHDGFGNGDSPDHRSIHFPGAKDKGAEKNFRDSKKEVHPIGDHLWDLFQIRKHEVKALFEKKLNCLLTEEELAQLPVFTNEDQIEKAIAVHADHYGVDWRVNLGDQIFHLSSTTASQVLRWLSNTLGNNSDKKKRPSPPLSHRTGNPINISATRLRHTRARQLARLGTPKHVLSFWLGHEYENTLDSYYNDPAEDARQINEAMKDRLVPLAMAFTGKLLDDESQATFSDDSESLLEFATNGDLKAVGKCGKHSFCTTTSIPIPCYRCKMFEPLVHAPHQEVLLALMKRQTEEDAMVKIGGNRKLLTPIDLRPDIRAVQACIARCDARKAELESSDD